METTRGESIASNRHMLEGLRMPLFGINVIDLTHYVAGPYCTKLAAGWGAEVVKIEKPSGGDPTRRIGPFYHDEIHLEKSLLFLYLNANKKSVTLNLKTKTGKQIFKEMIKGADILVENFNPRVMPGLGLDYETLEHINPKLIMTSISNYGVSGPYRDLKGWDICMYALGGMMYITGSPHLEPLQRPAFLAQYIGGLYGFLAALTALYCREETNIGQFVDVAIIEGIASMLESTALYWPYKEEVFRRFERRWDMYPYGVYPCKNGFVGIMVFQNRLWPKVAEIMESPELLDPRFSTPQGRVKYADEVDTLMMPWLLEHTREEIYKKGQAAGLPFGYVCTPEDLLNSAQLLARDYFVDIKHPLTGKTRYPGAPYKLSDAEWHAQRAPLLGEHNEEVYCGHLGYSKQDLVRLRDTGVI